jgi:large subunit ribosomal protein L3
MGKINRPRHGSMAFRPRKRASSQSPSVRTWPAVQEACLAGFAGFKAGMTHLRMVDDTAGSVTKGHEISVPVTVIEVPRLHVFCVRAYKKTPYGTFVAGDAFEEKFDKDIAKELTLPKKADKDALKKVEAQLGDVSDVRVLAYTSPSECGFGRKSADVLEIGVGGKTPKEKLEFAKGILGKDVKASDVFKDGEFVDAIAVTAGKGWQGAVKRFGISMQRRKSTGKYRHVGTLGPWHPARVMYTVPMAGQTGYHKRTEYNKRVLKVGAAGEHITPAGGFPNYGVVKGDYLLVKGSVAGPCKRLVSFRKALRMPAQKPAKPEIKAVSLDSKQGI